MSEMRKGERAKNCRHTCAHFCVGRLELAIGANRLAFLAQSQDKARSTAGASLSVRARSAGAVAGWCVSRGRGPRGGGGEWRWGIGIMLERASCVPSARRAGSTL